MRVGFCGAQGTGKTALAKAILLDPQFKDWEFVPSAARTAVEQGFKVNKDADPLSQLLTTCARITSQEIVSASGVNTISDRTPLDSLAYTGYQFREVWTDFKSNFYWQTSCDLVEMAMRGYDRVFYFPPYWQPKADGVRSDDLAYQKDIDGLIQILIRTLKVDCITMPERTIEERVWFIGKYI